MENLLSNVHHVYLSFFLTNNKLRRFPPEQAIQFYSAAEAAYARINNICWVKAIKLLQDAEKSQTLSGFPRIYVLSAYKNREINIFSLHSTNTRVRAKATFTFSTGDQHGSRWGDEMFCSFIRMNCVLCYFSKLLDIFWKHFVLNLRLEGWFTVNWFEKAFKV